MAMDLRSRNGKGKTMADLQSRLDEFKKAFESGAPPYNATQEAIETMHRATAELEASGLANKALRVETALRSSGCSIKIMSKWILLTCCGKAPWWLAFSGDTGDPIAIWSWRLYRESILRSRTWERRSWC